MTCGPALVSRWLGYLVGVANVASIQGAVLFGTDSKPIAQRPRIRLSPLQEDRRWGEATSQSLPGRRACGAPGAGMGAFLGGVHAAITRRLRAFFWHPAVTVLDS